MRNLYRVCLLLLVIAVFAVPAASGGEGALQLELHGLVVSSVPAGAPYFFFISVSHAALTVRTL